MDGAADYPALRMEQVEDGMRYTLPPRKDRFGMVFIPVLLAAWAWGSGSVIRSMPNHDSGFDPSWLLLWVGGGLLAFYRWLGFVAGKELVTLSIGTLKIKRTVLGLEPLREYDTTRIRNIRLSAQPAAIGTRRRLGPFNYGHIAFDYGAKTIRFGAGLEGAEAWRLIEELKSRYGI